ncbi:MAG: hypothetical protein K6G27_06525, partial [Lachnospiraceae bacterium]|nr:hypothetical protein [Lachnospiraceae bacterium]
MFNKNLVKKSTALAITGALTIAMAATVMAAPGGFNGDRGPGGNGGFSGNAGSTGNGGPTGNTGLAGNAGPGEIMGQEMNGGFWNVSENSSEIGFDGGFGQNEGERPELPEGIDLAEDRPELPEGEEMTGERPELPEGEEMTGERPELPGGEEMTGERPELPEGADSETDFSGVAVRTDLTEASGNSIMKKGAKGQKPSGESSGLHRGEGMTGERPELPGGEEMTGERPELPEGEQTGRMGQRGERGRGMKGIDTTNIASAVSELEDGEVKTNLETLLEEYESAKTALETAVSDEAEDVDTYRKAEMEAMKALR